MCNSHLVSQFLVVQFINIFINCILANLSDSGHAKSQECSLPSQSLFLVNEIRDVQIADLNLDGNDDIVTVFLEEDSIGVLMGDGRGGFGDPEIFSVGDTPASVAIGDLNSDGALDLVVANALSDDVSVLLNDGTGIFPSTVSIPSDNSGQIKLEDFDQDGNLDFATLDQIGQIVHVQYGIGDGQFEDTFSSAVGSNPIRLDVGDVNNDQLPDIVVTNNTGNSVSVIHGQNNREFAPSNNITVGYFPSLVRLGDLNNDNNLDLIVTEFFGGDVNVLLGEGTGQFQKATGFDFGLISAGVFSTNPSDMELLDLNNDSNLDLLLADTRANELTVVFGNGDGSFGDFQKFATARPTFPDNGGTLAVGNFNHDSICDVAIVTRDRFLTILLGQSEAAFEQVLLVSGGDGADSSAFADFDQDNILDMAIASENIAIFPAMDHGVFGAPVFESAVEPTSIVTADFDNDGIPDIAVCENIFGQNDMDQVSVRFGSGDFGFEEVTNIEALDRPYKLVVSDLNEDEFPDLVVASISGDVELMIFFGMEGRQFRDRIDFNFSGNPRDIAARDIDNDGDNDIVALVSLPNSIRVFENVGGNRFNARPPHSTSHFSNAFAIEHFDTDGNLDVAIALENSIQFVFGNGNGTFGSESEVNTVYDDLPSNIVAVDINSDRILDFAVTLQPQSLAILIGDGEGDFSTTFHPVASIPNSITVADIDGDSDIDFAIADRGTANNTGWVALLQNQCNDFLLGDVNMDGEVDLLDVVPFIQILTQGLFQQEADINMDGAVDLNDVAPFIDLLVD